MEILKRDNNIYNLIYFANFYHSLEDIYQVGDISMKQQNHMAAASCYFQVFTLCRTLNIITPKSG